MAGSSEEQDQPGLAKVLPTILKLLFFPSEIFQGQEKPQMKKEKPRESSPLLMTHLGSEEDLHGAVESGPMHAKRSAALCLCRAQLLPRVIQQRPFVFGDLLPEGRSSAPSEHLQPLE